MSSIVKKRHMIILVVAILVITGMAILILRFSTEADVGDLPQDPLDNPLYSAYDFDNPDTIYIGTQPLFSPTGLISEAMEHDLILEEDLMELGFKIKFLPFLKGFDVNQFIMAGLLDGGIGGDMPTLTIASKGNALIPVKVQDGQTWLMAKKSFLLKELKGKRIGYAPGSNAHFSLLNLMASSGLSEKDVKLEPLPVNAMPEALEQGDIDAFAAWEPTASIAESKYGFSRCFGAPSLGFMYFDKDIIIDHPVVMRAIVASAARSIAWLREGSSNRLLAGAWNVSKANILTGDTYPLTFEEDAAVAERDLLFSFWDMTGDVGEVDLSDDSLLAREFAFLSDLGKVEGDIPWSVIRDSFDPLVMAEILNDPTINRPYVFNSENGSP